MTYRTNAKPRRRRVVNWGAVFARMISGTLWALPRLLLVAWAVGFVVSIVHVSTHIGSPAEQVWLAWVTVVLSFTGLSISSIFWGEHVSAWYRTNIKRPVFEEREL